MSAGLRLARAIEASGRAAGCALRIAAASERPWASATFVGARHSLVLDAAPSAALDAWLAALADEDLDIPGHLVANVAVTRGRTGARVEALVLVAA